MTTTEKSKALQAELASLCAEKGRLEVQLQDAAFDGHDTTDLQARIAAAAARIEQIEGALQAGARRAVADSRAADQAKVKAARAALVSGGKNAAAKGRDIAQLVAALADGINELTAPLEETNFVVLTTLNCLRGDPDRPPVAVNYSLHPILQSTVQAVIANLMFRVGVKQAEASGFVVDVPGVVNQSVGRLLHAVDDDISRLPCFKAEGAAAPVVDPGAPPPGQADQRKVRRSQLDPGCFPVEEAA